jgi:hypothetical protein
MRTESLEDSYLALPEGPGPHPGVVVIHEASGLNDNIRDICGRFAEQGYAALGVDLFGNRNRAVCMARMMIGALAGNLDQLRRPRSQVRAGTPGRPPRGRRRPDRRDRFLLGRVDRAHLGMHREPSEGDRALLRRRPKAQEGDPPALPRGGIVAGQTSRPRPRASWKPS